MAQTKRPSESRGFRHSREFESRGKLTKLQARWVYISAHLPIVLDPGFSMHARVQEKTLHSYDRTLTLHGSQRVGCEPDV